MLSRLDAFSNWRCERLGVIEALRFSQDLLDPGQRQRCVAGDALSKLVGLFQCRPGSGQLADEPVLLGIVGRERVAGEQHLEGDVVGDSLRQADDAALPSDESAFHLRQPEFGIFGGNDQVAAQRHLEAATERPALDGGDQRLAHHGLGDAAESATGKDRGLPVRECLEVHARAERPAGAGEHAHRQRRIGIQQIEGGRHLDGDLAVDGILFAGRLMVMVRTAS